MAKNYLCYIGFFLIVICFSEAVTGTSLDQTRRNVAKIYNAEVGVREKTGKNDGERIKEYLAICNLPEGNQYCACFVSWVFVQSNVTAIISAWSPAWFPAAKTIYTRGTTGNNKPKQADVLGIYIQDKGRVGHVGFIDEWPDNSAFCISVEANTSLSTSGGRNDYDGQGVERKRRLKSQIYKASRWL